MALGKSGEDMAVHFLRHKRYRIIERNFRTKLGEIDIIAADGKALVFIEVKTRLSGSYGHPSESVTLNKQRKIRKLAEMFLARMKNRLHEFDSIRFDFIGVTPNDPSNKIEHIENAF